MSYGANATINTKKYTDIYRIDNLNICIKIRTTEKIFINSLIHTIFLRKLPLSFISNANLTFCNLIINDTLFNLKHAFRCRTQLNECLSYISEHKVESVYEKYTQEKYSLKYSTEITHRQHMDYETHEIKNYPDNIKSPRLDGTKLLIELIKQLNIGNMINMKFVD